MKKMTQKEFKQILADSGMPFESYGWEGILNALSGWTRKLAYDLEANNLFAGASKLHDESDAIYKALEARGYYDDCVKSN